jgi:hypothetical protein
MTLRPLAGLATLSALVLPGLLTGCGVAGTGIHPGAAVEVGDDTISMSTVDTTASNYCSAIEDQLAQNHQVLPMRYLRAGIAGQLALVSAARQLADDYGVEPGVQYERKVSDLEGAISQLSEGEQEAVIDVESSSTYISSVQQAVGEQVLQDQGTKRPQPEAATQAGKEAFTKWLDEHDVSLDPKLGVTIQDASAVPTDSSVSFPVGSTAKLGLAETPDQKYAAALPDALRCG